VIGSNNKCRDMRLLCESADILEFVKSKISCASDKTEENKLYIMSKYKVELMINRKAPEPGEFGIEIRTYIARRDHELFRNLNMISNECLQENRNFRRNRM